MKMPLFAYAEHHLGDGIYVNETIEREEILEKSLNVISLNLRLSTFDSYKGELILELKSKNGKNHLFTFYDRGAMEWFYQDMGVRDFNELGPLWDKRNLEGFFEKSRL